MARSNEEHEARVREKLNSIFERIYQLTDRLLDVHLKLDEIEDQADDLRAELAARGDAKEG